MRKFLVCLLLLLIAVPALAGSLEAGAVFLMIFPGSRATSLGGAFSAVEGDIFSTYYNSAGLSFNEEKIMGLQHANWLPGLYRGMYYEYLTFLFPVGNEINITGSITYLTTGETEAGDSTQSWRWQTYDIAPKIGACMPITDNLGLSLEMKYIFSFLAPEDVIEWLSEITGTTIRGGTGQSWAIDAGLFYKWNDFQDIQFLEMQWLKTLRIGLSFQNIGPDISYIENGESDPLPRLVRIGTSLALLENKRHKLYLNTDLVKILVNLDYNNFQNLWNDSWKSMGLEYTFNELFSLRTGYFIDKVGKRIGPTFGVGFQYKSFRFDVSVDQEIYDFETTNYRISAQYSF